MMLRAEECTFVIPAKPNPMYACGFTMPTLVSRRFSAIGVVKLSLWGNGSGRC
jgi:hypothetical protein